MLATINRLMEEAAPPVKVGGVPKPGSRIVSRQPVHQMLTLVPRLTEPQQLLCLRRLRQLLNRSLYNLHVCTSGLQLVSVILRWLQPDAAPAGTEMVDEILELLAALGGYRATAQELRTLFELLQQSLTPDVTPGRATADQLLRLLTRWCEPSALDRREDRREDGAPGPRGPIACFDLDGVGGLTLPGELATDLIGKGAFAIGAWVRLEDESTTGVATDGVLLFALLGKGGDVGIEVYLQPVQQQLSVCVYGSSQSTTARLMGGKKKTAERCSLSGVKLQPGRWHLLLFAMRKAGPLKGRHDAIVLLDGKKVNTTPCAYPASLQEKQERRRPRFRWERSRCRLPRHWRRPCLLQAAPVEVGRSRPLLEVAAEVAHPSLLDSLVRLAW